MMLRYRRAEDWITSPQIPSHLLEDNAKLHCMRGAADRSEYRQAAGAGTEAVAFNKNTASGA
jgi:hypothetical protein